MLTTHVVVRIAGGVTVMVPSLYKFIKRSKEQCIAKFRCETEKAILSLVRFLHAMLHIFQLSALAEFDKNISRKCMFYRLSLL